MASTPASSEVDPEEDAGTMRLNTQTTGRAAEYPDFAIIWSFLENFRHLLHFPDLSLDDLEDGFNSHSSENGKCQTDGQFVFHFATKVAALLRKIGPFHPLYRSLSNLLKDFLSFWVGQVDDQGF